MRPLLALALALAAALPALAQPVLSDSSTVYVSPAFGLVSHGNVGTAFTLGGDVGWRLGPSADVGLRLFAGDLSVRDGEGAFLTVGPTAGVTHRLAGGLELDARALATATFANLGAASTRDGFGLQLVRGTAQATVSRSIPIIGSLRLAPTLGVFASACSTIGYDHPGPNGKCAEAGVLSGVELRFRAFGANVSIPIIARLAGVGNTLDGQVGAFDYSQAPIHGGIRISF